MMDLSGGSSEGSEMDQKSESIQEARSGALARSGLVSLRLSQVKEKRRGRLAPRRSAWIPLPRKISANHLSHEAALCG